MRLAIVGSRSISKIRIENYIKESDCEIVSGGARGVDLCAAEYARANKLTLVEFLPDYKRYGRAAPLVRNREIVDYADRIIIFWNGSSRGTLSVIEYAKAKEKPYEVIICE